MSDSEEEKTPKRQAKLPYRILPIKNRDKEFHEKWTKGRDPLNPPAPWRMVCMGPPNVGKGTIIKNMIIRAKPEFEEIYVIHPDAEYTQEWLDVGATMLDEIPRPEEWEGEVKTLCILDDLEYKQMKKEQKYALDRLYGYVSTHKNVCVALAAQDWSNVPPIIRRCSNLWVLWKTNDMDSQTTLARRAGIKPATMNMIMHEHMPGEHDSLWVDLTKKSPYPLRLNGYDQLIIES